MKIFKYKISSDNGKIELKTYQAKQIHLHGFQFALESTTHDYMTINTPSCLEIITLYELSPSQIKKSQSYMEKLLNALKTIINRYAEI